MIIFTVSLFCFFESMFWRTNMFYISRTLALFLIMSPYIIYLQLMFYSLEQKTRLVIQPIIFLQNGTCYFKILSKCYFVKGFILLFEGDRNENPQFLEINAQLQQTAARQNIAVRRENETWCSAGQWKLHDRRLSCTCDKALNRILWYCLGWHFVLVEGKKIAKEFTLSRPAESTTDKDTILPLTLPPVNFWKHTKSCNKCYICFARMTSFSQFYYANLFQNSKI